MNETEVTTKPTTVTEEEQARVTELIDKALPPPKVEQPPTPGPNLLRLCETPLVIDPVLSAHEFFVKCIAPKGTTWVVLNQNSLLVHDNEFHDNSIARKTMVNVTFHTHEVEEYKGGCGGGYDMKTIGYVSGKMLQSGTVDMDAPRSVVYFDRDKGKFFAEGSELVGAELMILGDNCIGLIIGAKFK